jgi:excisionase family DNA binding protein
LPVVWRITDMTHPPITLTEARERAAISVEQAAHLLGIGRQSAYAATGDGTLPTVRIGRRLLVPTERLLAMLAGDSPHEAPWIHETERPTLGRTPEDGPSTD